ncbi:CgeB family protein [Thermaerobacillus caldiproteolyticus]|uniref:CgeB family protein n=1 Tax=Thermaerobacillus caldiproteolyticus TaxID=247480 RepID=UPI001889DB5F|nr:glycosyltransferase [Anoxybacillus caldiproteolyticus]QPA30687.1 glycosyltransferase [Anoxybacillus caldiproteolyticus]
MEIFLERAKDGLLTCKIQKENNRSYYLYSKYKPLRLLETLPEIKKDKNYVILGIGLGYEIVYVSENTNGKVVVIDYNHQFYNLIKENNELKPNIDNRNIEFLFGDEYINCLSIQNDDFEIIYNPQILELHPAFFAKVLMYLHPKKKACENKTVVLMEHNALIEDCLDAFKKKSFQCIKLDWATKEKLLLKISNIHPAFIFTINYSEIIAEISETLQIPYISWTVDTPCYSLYSLKIDTPLSAHFIYDEAIVHTLQKRGVTNVYYLPVAGNPERMMATIRKNNNIQMHYDVSFAGNLTISEYTQKIEPYLSAETKKIINTILEEQEQNKTEFTIRSKVNSELVHRIQEESHYPIIGNELLSPEEKLSFLLGREHSQRERIRFVQQLEKHFSCAVFGNDSWSIFAKNYQGYADYYEVYPLVFHHSKININLTRTFVETGLPLRVFDVLSSKGFLLTNDKRDIHRLFKDGRDLVVFRDNQDLVEQIDYYLHHEEERIRIAESGHEILCKYHTYIHRIEKIIELGKRRSWL